VSPLHIYPALQEHQGARTSVEDIVLAEEPLEIRLDGRRLAATMRTPISPAQDLLLAQGLLFSEGVISGLDDIEQMEFRSRRHDSSESVDVVSVTLRDASSVPDALWERPAVANSVRFEALVPLEPAPLDLAILRALPDKMRPHQPLFEATGGAHAAAIFDANGEMLCCYEDIGRHNASDKAIGFGLENYFVPATQPLIMLVAGRVSFEIIQKALVARIGTVCSVSAASSLAVELAQKNRLNLVGFLRPSGLTVYTGEPI
jgi:FdhD protein